MAPESVYPWVTKSFALLIFHSLGKSSHRLKHFKFQECESESRSVVSDSLRPHGLYSAWNSPGQNTGVGSLSLLQWIFLTQELNQESPALQGGFFTSLATREAEECNYLLMEKENPGTINSNWGKETGCPIIWRHSVQHDGKARCVQKLGSAS